MRLLLVIDRFGSGGAQTQMALLAQRIRAAGHDPIVATYHPNDLSIQKEYLKYVELVSLRKTSKFDVSIVFQIADTIRDRRPDAIISFLTTPNVYAVLAAVFSGFSGPVVCSERNTFPRSRPSVRELAARLPLHRATWVTANTQAQAAAISRALPSLAAKIRTIPNAVDHTRFTPRTPSADRQSRVLIVARIVPSKNVLGMIDAVSRIRSAHPHLHVTWVGRIHDEEYFRQCAHRLDELRLTSFWRWAPETGNVLDHYRNADFLVLPSFHEGMPNCVLEAMACGLPCGISNVADARHILGNSGAGVMFNPHDPRDIADRLLPLLESDKQTYLHMSCMARQQAVSNFSPEQMVSSYLDLLA